MGKKVITDSEFLQQIGEKKLRTPPEGFKIKQGTELGHVALQVNASVSSEEIRQEDIEKTDFTKNETVSNGNSVLTEDKLQAIINASLSSAIAPLQRQLEEAQQVIASEAKQKQELQQQIAAIAKEKEHLQSELVEAQKAEKNLQDLGKLQGRSITSFPSVNLTVGSKSDKPQGAVREFLQIQNKAPVVYKFDRNNRQYPSYDNRELNKFAKQNLQALIDDAEDWGRANGFFRGAAVTNDATVGADIVGGFLPVLSAIMRQNNRPGFIWWQFPTTKIEFNKGEGDNIRIPRAAYLPEPSAASDRLLSGNGVYTRITSSDQSLSTGVVNATLQEWGLGKDSSNPPVTIVAFTASYSMIDLLAILNRNLGYDYYSWENLAIRSLLTPTTRIVYNKKDAVVTDPATLVAGDGGRITANYLAALRGYMKGVLKIPPFLNQKYVLTLPSTSVTRLRQDLDKYWAAPNSENLFQLTNILNPSLIAPSETDRITGYVADIEGFMIFEDNTFGTGASGSPGVRTQNIAGQTNVITRSGYAFGADAIGRGIGTEMEIRFDTITDFQRSSRVAWFSEEAFIAMDVDPTGYSDTSAVPQQLRVLEVRFPDVAL